MAKLTNIHRAFFGINFEMEAISRLPLFVSQGDDGVESRRSPRRIKAKHNSDQRGKSTSEDDGPRVDEDGPADIPGDRNGCGSAQYRANKPAD
jgi:hypothetical protein